MRDAAVSVNHLSENTCPKCNLPVRGDCVHFVCLKKITFNCESQQMSGLQILAFLSGLAGLGATIGATVSNEWKATSRASSVITATWVLQGLWNNCAGNAIGALHCRPHHTILNLDGEWLTVLLLSNYLEKNRCSHCSTIPNGTAHFSRFMVKHRFSSARDATLGNIPAV